jgi:hypothetical protein
VNKYTKLAKKLLEETITQDYIDSILEDKSECHYSIKNFPCEYCSASCYKRILFTYLHLRGYIEGCKKLEDDIENISTEKLREMLLLHEKIDLMVAKSVNSFFQGETRLIKIKQHEDYLRAYKIHYLFQNSKDLYPFIFKKELIKNELKIRNK